MLWRAVSQFTGKSAKVLAGQNSPSFSPADSAVWYLPRISLKDGRLVGIEAVLPEPENVPEATAPAASEDTNALPLLLQTATKQACRWQHDGLPMPPLTVRLPAGQELHNSLVETIAAALAHSTLKPCRFEISFSEQSLQNHFDEAVRALYGLKSLGISLTLDDFGHCSLETLCHLPIDRMKVRSAFVAGIEEDPLRETIVRILFGIARSIHCKTLADGVETMAQLEWVRRQGCDEIQGPVFHPSLAPADMGRLLTDWPGI